MIYDTTRHAICKNDGTTIAYFQINVFSKTAFEIVDKINENYDLRAVIDNKDEIISHLEEKVDKLESQLKDIEEYGTEEINEAVKLRQALAKLRVDYSEFIAAVKINYLRGTFSSEPEDAFDKWIENWSRKIDKRANLG